MTASLEQYSSLTSSCSWEKDGYLQTLGLMPDFGLERLLSFGKSVLGSTVDEELLDIATVFGFSK